MTKFFSVLIIQLSNVGKARMEFFLITLVSFMAGFFFCKLVFKRENTDALKNEITELKELKIRLEEQNRTLQESRLTGESLTQTLQKEFENIANKALLSNQNRLTEVSKNSLKELLELSQKDLGKELTKLQENVTGFNKESAVSVATLKEQIKKLEENNLKIVSEASALTNALRQNQNVKGAYGEALLENIFKSAGLLENWQYEKHYAVKVEADGQTRELHPDYVLKLPNEKHIVIDSKLTLESYIEYVNEDNKADKERKYKQFREAILRRVSELSVNAYHSSENLGSPDFTLMYVPLESSLSTIYADMDLVNAALNKNVIIIGTASILSTVRIIAHLWSLQAQNENVKHIASAAAGLYNKFSDFCDNLTDLSLKFDNLRRAFTTTINRFKRGDDSIFKRVEELKQLGISPTKQINPAYLTDVTDEIEAEEAETAV